MIERIMRETTTTTWEEDPNATGSYELVHSEETVITENTIDSISCIP